MKAIIIIINLLIVSQALAETIQGGIVRSSYETVIKAQVDGFITNIVPLQEDVEAGDRLVTISCQVQKAQVRVSDATVKMKLAEKRNIENLVKQGALSQSELDVANASLLIASADRTVKNNLAKRCLLTNQLKGVVVELYAGIGAYVTVGDPLLRVVDNNDVHVEFYASEEDFNKYPINKKVLILKDGRTLTHGVIDKRSSYVNENGTFMVTVKVEKQSDKLFVGLRVIVSIEQGSISE